MVSYLALHHGEAIHYIQIRVRESVTILTYDVTGMLLGPSGAVLLHMLSPLETLVFSKALNSLRDAFMPLLRYSEKPGSPMAV